MPPNAMNCKCRAWGTNASAEEKFVSKAKHSKFEGMCTYLCVSSVRVGENVAHLKDMRCGWTVLGCSPDHDREC